MHASYLVISLSLLFIQQIVHAVFYPLGVKQHFPCDSNF
jgi:hypothetical protein